jgi:putative flippase GtrA
VPAEGTAMTCPTLVCRVPAPMELGRFLRSAHGTARRASARHLRRLRDADAPAAQLVRFGLAGGLATAVQVLLFSLLVPVGSLSANVAAWAVSTALANELHRRRTFRAGAQVGWVSAQWEGGGLALVGLLATTGALALLTSLAPDADVVAQTALVLAVTTAVGLARFVALRWSFVVRRGSPA